MISLVWFRQQQLLTLLLRNKEDLTLKSCRKGSYYRQCGATAPHHARARWYGRQGRNSVHRRPPRAPLGPCHCQELFPRGIIPGLPNCSSIYCAKEQGTDELRE